MPNNAPPPSDRSAALIAEVASLRARVRELEGQLVLQRGEAPNKAAAARLEQLRQAVEVSLDGLAICDLEGRIVTANAAMHELLEYEPEGLIGLFAMDIVPEELREEASAEVTTVYAGQRLPAGERPLRTEGGRTVTTSVSMAPIHSGEGDVSGMVATVRDVTEQRRLEEALQRARKLEAVGLLAGGLAHDFSNVLTRILGNLSLSREYAPGSADGQRALRDAERACRGARDVTARLVTLAHSSKPRRLELPYWRLLNAVQDRLGEGAPTLRSEAPKQLRPLQADLAQLAQALGELVRRAAAKDAEDIEVVIEATELRVGPTTGMPLDQGPYICLRLSAAGQGELKATPEELDPYDDRWSSGDDLALVTAYAVIKHHGGLLALAESEAGRAFSVYLPAVE